MWGLRQEEVERTAKDERKRQGEADTARDKETEMDRWRDWVKEQETQRWRRRAMSLEEGRLKVNPDKLFKDIMLKAGLPTWLYFLFSLSIFHADPVFSSLVFFASLSVCSFFPLTCSPITHHALAHNSLTYSSPHTPIHPRSFTPYPYPEIIGDS